MSIGLVDYIVCSLVIIQRPTIKDLEQRRRRRRQRKWLQERQGKITMIKLELDCWWCYDLIGLKEKNNLCLVSFTTTNIFLL